MGPGHGQEAGRPPGNPCVWAVAMLLLAAILAGGACLVLYLALPPSDAPPWLAAAGLALVAFPWVFWLATCLYRCVGARPPPAAVAVERQPSRPAAVAPSASNKSARSAASGSGRAKREHSPVDSPGGARRVHFGNATVVGGQEAGEGAAAAADEGSGDGKALSRDSSSVASHESEVPLTYSMS